MNLLNGHRDGGREALQLGGICERLRSWLFGWLYGVFPGFSPRRYRVTPRCRAAVFRRELLAGVLHCLKQNPMD